jgi:hypothetical protein
MPIAVLVLALVAYGYVVIVYPEVRRPALIGGALVAAGLAAYFLLATPNPVAITPEELTLDRIDVERTVRGATIRGRVHNRSEQFRLREMTLSLRLHDCPTPQAAPETCPVIGEGQAIARPDAPAGQIRAFSAHFSLAGVPPVAGTLRWDLAIAATRGTAS